MDQRIVDFISALRAGGARVSLAESADAIRAVEAVGVLDRAMFRYALRATLVKEPADVAKFEQVFPLFFGNEGEEYQPPQNLTPEQQEQLQNALDSLKQQLQELMRMLANGEKPSAEELQQHAKQAGVHFKSANQGNEAMRKWLTERMLREMGLTPAQLREAIEALMKQLKMQGMESEGRQEVRETVQANAEAMREQVSRFVGRNMLNQPDENPRRNRMDDLMNRPLGSLNASEADELRQHVRRLVARLRSRAALRQRHAHRGQFDVKSTIRHNQRNMGVPIEIKYKRRRLKPKLCVIVDVSTSMRPVAEFMLRMVYEMQDQVSRARSFAFISDIQDISPLFSEHRPEDAVPLALDQLPPGHYNTDLGNSLQSFCRDHLDAVDQRTTLIFVGDGRNNYNDPRLDLVSQLKRRARRVIFMNPEQEAFWHQGDSDMYAYAPLCDAVLQVATLKQLEEAIDKLFGG